MQPRPLEPEHDLPHLAALLGHTRAGGGIWHPGGIQWWLRELGRDGFAAFVWPREEDDTLGAFVMRDGTYVIAESDERGPDRLELLDFAESRLRDAGATEMQTSAAEGSRLHLDLGQRGFAQTGTSLELMADTEVEPPPSTVLDGFRFASLSDVDDNAYIDGHRAAWSDKRPSPYRRELHEAVKRMPQFRPELVTIALAPDGTVASYCIGWLDAASQTLEIEPLGTHRDYRRQGLARAVVQEVIHRASENGARHVLVWNDPQTNAPAYGLYTSAGMTPRRRIADLTRRL
jgi:ribosomal protein S18 acetylase RimI-like enzyme